MKLKRSLLYMQRHLYMSTSFLCLEGRILQRQIRITGKDGCWTPMSGEREYHFFKLNRPTLRRMVSSRQLKEVI